MESVFFNDRIFAANNIPFNAADRGLLLADGLFETLRVSQNYIRHFDRHWQRLISSAHVLNFCFNLTIDQLQNYIQQTLAANDLSHAEAVVRVTLTRGSGERGLLPKNLSGVSLLIAAFPWRALAKKTYTSIIASTRRNEYSPLSRIKSLNYLDNILAKMEAEQRQVDDAILLNTKGNIACATAANLFIVCEQKIYTPPLTEGVLPGIVRSLLIGLPDVSERIITLDELRAADEIFISNSLLGIMPIASINEQVFNVGRKTQQLQDELLNLR